MTHAVRFHLYAEAKKQVDRTEQNRFREQTDGCRGGGREGEKRVREMKRCKLSATKSMSHGYEMSCMGNTVNNYVISLFGERW